MPIQLYSGRALLGIFMLTGVVAFGATSYDLSCALVGLNGSTCAAGPSVGTVTIADAGLNQVSVNVDLLNSAQKFRDLMLNFNGGASGITGISSGDGQVSLNADGYSITPYSGLFDLGSSAAQGWNGDSGYATILTGIGGTLTAAQFSFTDSLGNVYAGLHIQSGAKVGGVLPDLVVTVAEVPEPSTFALAGLGLLFAVWARFKRPRAVLVRCRSANR